MLVKLINYKPVDELIAVAEHDVEVVVVGLVRLLSYSIETNCYCHNT